MKIKIKILMLGLLSLYLIACDRKPSATNSNDLINNGTSDRFVVIYSEAKGSFGKTIFEDKKTGKKYLFVKYLQAGGLVLMSDE